MIPQFLEMYLLDTACPGSSDPFYVLSYNGSLLLDLQYVVKEGRGYGFTHRYILTNLYFVYFFRIRDPPTYETIDSNFQMSFKYRNSDNPTGITYFAFTYPYTYKELQSNLDRLHRKSGNGSKPFAELASLPETTIYFHRENVVRSLEKRRLDLLTITDLSGISQEREETLANLFTEESNNRSYRFPGKKTVFISARVHPGETCSSHVMNGLVRFLLKENDPRAAVLRKKYVFKLVPMLNPDGVVNGHYRYLYIIYIIYNNNYLVFIIKTAWYLIYVASSLKFRGSESRRVGSWIFNSLDLNPYFVIMGGFEFNLEL